MNDLKIGQKAPTMKDIARLSGVSVTTVARALKNKPDVSLETMERVCGIAEAIGYLPNALARDLRAHTTRSIGLIISDNSNPFYARLMRGVQDAAIKRDYHVVFANSDEKYHIEVEAVKFLQQLRVAGLLLAPTENKIDHVLQYGGSEFPLIIVSRRLEDIKANWVLVDDIKGAYLATSHLLETGYREIMFVNGPLRISNARDRLIGYMQALEHYGVAFQDALLSNGSLNAGDGYEVVSQMLREATPEAILCYSDFVAIGVMKAVTEKGLRIPEDVAVVGYDDIELMRYLPIPLTTVRHPICEIGRQAANLLMDIIEKKKPPKLYNILLDPKLIVRGSTMAKTNHSTQVDDSKVKT